MNRTDVGFVFSWHCFEPIRPVTNVTHSEKFAHHMIST